MRKMEYLKLMLTYFNYLCASQTLKREVWDQWHLECVLSIDWKRAQGLHSSVKEHYRVAR